MTENIEIRCFVSSLKIVNSCEHLLHLLTTTMNNLLENAKGFQYYSEGSSHMLMAPGHLLKSEYSDFRKNNNSTKITIIIMAEIS